MPSKGTDVEKFQFTSLLVLGPAGIGKTVLLTTCPKGVYVLASDDPKKLNSAAFVDPDFSFDPVNSSDGAKLLAQFEAAYSEASRGVAEGRYKTIVWDTITSFSALLINAELNATDSGSGPDGRRAYERHGKRIYSATTRLLALKAHVVVLAHDYPVSGELDGQLKKTGDGILPAIDGSVRARIASLFQDVVYMAKVPGSEDRVFKTRIGGVYGPRSNNLPGVESIPADVGGMIDRIVKGPGAERPKKAPSRPTDKPPILRPPVGKVASK
jgi:hypothetical protein